MSMRDNIKNKKFRTIFFIIVLIIIICSIMFQILFKNMMKIVIKEKTNVVATDAAATVVVCDSIVQGIRDNDLPNGEYTLRVTGKIGTTNQTIDYPIELINFYNDVTYTTNQSLGDTTTTKKMLIVKYHKNLTVNTGVTVTATTVSNYCYKKGMYVCVMGDLFNNGTITMTARGTYEQSGENVYLWKNTTGTYEYVPALGAAGGPGVGGTNTSGTIGYSGTNRQTGGGGSGGAMGTDPKPGGSGGAGTSYSGGSGGGGTYNTSGPGIYSGGAGSSTGGAGGAGGVRGNTYTTYASGGSGNGPGAGAYSTGNAYANAGTKGLWGTGGLLVVYSNTLYNAGEISAKGSDNPSSRYSSEGRHAGGGASGGGSVNIFANEIGINTKSTALRGYATINETGITYAIAGSNGGNGSVTVTDVGAEINSKLKELTLNVNQEYILNKNNFEIISQKEIPSGIITLDNLEYSIVDSSIATIDSNGKITPIKEGKTKVKIVEQFSRVTTYIYLVIKNGSVPDIKLGNNFTVALKKDGTVWSYGKNDLGQLGNGANQTIMEPKKIANLSNIEKISTGYNHSIALNNNGEVYTWGANTFGQLGTGQSGNSNIPIKVEGLSNIVKVAGYQNISVALDSDGKVYVWGNGYSNIPTRIVISSKIVDISGNLLLKENGKVVTLSALTTEIASLSKVSKISCGADHYLGLTDIGTVYSWGDNSSGESAKSTSTSTAQVVAIEMYDISAGLNHTIMQAQNGDVYVCGTNSSGQIGLNTTSSTSTLTKISGVPKIEKISAGSGTHSAIIDSTGFIWTTGLSTFGELGFGNTTQYKVYTKLGSTGITSNIQNESLDIGENRTINLRLENTFNLKIDLIDENQNNFTVTSSDPTKIVIEGKTIIPITYGKSFINITHTPTGQTKQIEISVIMKMESIVQGIIERDISDGIYPIAVGDEIYNIELYNYYDDIRYSLLQGQSSRTISLGNSTADQTMLVVKYHKNLTIDKGVTITPTTRKKGMYICVLGNTYNKGNISMTARGAIGEGQNVYLWKNIDNSYEYVPKTGSPGGLGVSISSGHAGITGINRQTAGGGSGASAGTRAKPGGNGGTGTSYSGGPGGGGTYHALSTGTYAGSSGSNEGGTGGYGATKGSTPSRMYASGGTGNGPGAGSYSISNAYANAGTLGLTGTGGLLVLYTDNLVNEGNIISKGTDNLSYKYASELGHAGGGASGGGSVNIFAKTVELYQEINANGGEAKINRSGIKYPRAGSNGGTGSVTVNQLGSILTYSDKSINIKMGEQYLIDNNKLKIVKLNNIQTEDLNLGEITYEIEDTSIASIIENNIVPLKIGKTKLKIIDTTNNLETYLYIEITYGVGSKISVADYHTIALKENGTVWSFGRNNMGQLGDGTKTNKNIPVQVIKQNSAKLENIVDIYSRGNSNIGVDNLGNAYTWGYARIGTTDYNQVYATIIPGITNVKKATIYGSRFILLNDLGEIYYYGSGYSTPTKVNTKEKIVEISSNQLLSESGKIYNIATPYTQNVYLENVAKISVGKSHTIILTTDGKVYTFGTGLKGELGNGTNINSDIPVLVKDKNGNFLENIVDISAGNECSMALDYSGKVFVWGDNISSKIGIEETSSNIATQIVNAQDKKGNTLSIPLIERISAGTNNTVLSDINGNLYTVGIGTDGQLGTEDNISRNIYTKIGELDIITLPEYIKTRIDQNIDVVINLSSTFNLKTDAISEANITINNTNSNISEINKIEGVDNTGIIDNSKLLPNFRITGINPGINTIVAYSESSNFKKNIVIEVMGSENGIVPANIEGGDSITQTLKEDGTLWSFGKNDIGQLGINSREEKNIPTKVSYSEIIKANSVGLGHTIFLTENGKIFTFGKNNFGQLGIGTTGDKELPIEISGLSNIIKVKAVNNTTFALDNKGIVYAWGEGYTKIPQKLSINYNVIDISRNYFLADDGKVRTLTGNSEIQLCLRQNPDPEILEIVNEKIVQISEGTNHLLLLSESGKIYSYGDNVYGQLGDGGTLGKTNFISTVVSVSEGNILENIIEVSAGNRFSLALTNSGKVYAWGINGQMQLGNNLMQDSWYAIMQQDLNNIEKIDAGYYHSSAIDQQGDVWTWGNGKAGELGNYANDNYAKPQLVGKNIIETNTNNIVIEEQETFSLTSIFNTFNLYEEKDSNIVYESKDTSKVTVNSNTGEIVAISEGKSTVIAKEVVTNKIGVVQVRILKQGTFGENNNLRIEPKSVTSGKHTLLLKVDGTVWTYGQNTYGQLGIGTQVSIDNPVKINFDEGVKIVDIACGEEHSMALDNNGNVYVWGRNNYYQLGNSVDTYKTIPTKLTGISNIIKISAGNSNSFAVTQDKIVYSWGLNANGECGVGSYTNKITITKSKYLTDIIDIEPGKNHTLALKSTGDVLVTGSNLYGELGNGNHEIGKINVFAKVQSISNAVEIASGESHCIVIKDDGSVMVWGSNTYGGIGTGEIGTKNYLPILLPGIENIRYASASKGYTVLIDSTNSIYVSGLNNLGQLGNNTQTDLNAFTKLTTINNLISADSGIGYTVFTKTDGTVWACGDYNQGDITLISRTKGIIPKRVGNDEPGFENNEITIKVNEQKNIKNNYLYEFNLIKLEEDVDTLLEYTSINTQIAEVISGNLITGIKIGKTWVKARNIQTNNVETITVNVVDSRFSLEPKVVSGENYAAVLKSDGTIWTFGYNSNGQMSDGTNISKDMPTKTNVLSTYRDISAGSKFFIALRSDNTVWAVGDNSTGQLGQGDNVSKNKLIQVLNIKNVTRITAGDQHVIAVDSNGIIHGWGRNSEGQLGTNNINKDTKSPVVVGSINERIIDISAGINQSVIVTAKGKIYGFGNILNGCLSDLTNAYKVKVGQGYLLILTTDGNIYKYTNSTLTEVVNTNNVIDIDVTKNSNMYQSTDEKVYTWGENSVGQLGLNNTINAENPTPTEECTQDVFAIGSGYNNTYIIENSGTIYSSGNNEYGSLGNSTRNNSLIHTNVGNRQFEINPISKIMSVNDVENITLESEKFNVFNNVINDFSGYSIVSSNEEIVSVSDGVLTANSEGEAIITITDLVTGEQKIAQRYVVSLEAQRIDEITVNEVLATVSGENDYLAKIVTEENTAALVIKTKDITDEISLDINNFSGIDFGVLNTIVDVSTKTTQIPIYIKTSNGTIMSYIVNIEKLSTDTGIEEILVNSVKAKPISLTRYEAVVSEETEECITNVITKSEFSLVSIDGMEYEIQEQTKNISFGTDLSKTIIISIKSENGIEKEYTLVIYKQSELAELEMLTVDGNNAIRISEAKYAIAIDPLKTSVDIYAKTISNLVQLNINDGEFVNTEITKTIDINSNLTIVTIKVKISEEEIKEYTLEIYKKDSTKLDLLIVNGKVIVPKDNVYEMYLPSSEPTAIVRAIAADKTNFVKIDMNEMQLAESEKTVEITESKNEYIIKVIDHNMVETDYRLIIKREEEDTSLKNIIISNSDYENIIEVKEFVNNYEIKIPNTYTYFDIKALTGYSKSKVKINNFEYEINETTKNILLNEDNTVIIITVQSENEEYSEEYELTIKKMSSNTGIDKVIIDGVLLEYQGENKYEYNLTQPLENVHLEVVAEQNTSSVKINSGLYSIYSNTQEIFIESRTTTVNIYIKAEDGTIGMYELKINGLSDNTNISKVLVNEIEADYIEGENLYEIKSEASVYTIDVVLEDPLAIIKLGSDEPRIGQSSIVLPKEIENTVVIASVTSQNGLTTTDYQIVIKPKSNNASIDVLEVNNQIIEPDISGNYKTNIVHNISEINIKATAEDNNSVLSIAGFSDNTSIKEISVPITNRISTFEIEVIAEDGTAEIKTLEVEQLEGNTDLSEVKVGIDTENMQNAILNEDGTYYYKTERMDSIYVKATCSSEISNVKIDNNTANVITTTNLVNLDSEIKNVKITVIAEDGTEKIHDLYIEKISNDATLKQINSSQILNKEIYENNISLYIDEDLTQLDIQTITNNINATQKLDSDTEYSGNIMNKTIDLSGYTEEGLSVNLEIIAEDGITQNIYNITIYKIANLNISEVIINNEVVDYDLDLNKYNKPINASGAINITVKAENPLQTVYLLQADGITVISQSVGQVVANFTQTEQTKDYIIRIQSHLGSEIEESLLTIRKKSQDTGISYIKVDGLGTIKESDTKYKTTVSGKTNYPVEIKALEENARVKIDSGEYSLTQVLQENVFIQDGQNRIFNITVKSENGDEKIYQLEVATISSNRDLDEITVTDIETTIVDEQEIDTIITKQVTNYNPETKTYKVAVKERLESSTIKIKANSALTVVTVDDTITGVQNVQIDKILNLTGITTLPIRIKSADLVEETRYLEIIKLSANTGIELLEVDGFLINKDEFNNYETTLNDEFDNMTIRVKALDNKAKVVINNTGEGSLSENIIQISKGNNRIITIPIKIIAEDNSVFEYELKVNIISHNANVGKIIVEGIEYTEIEDNQQIFIQPDTTQVNVGIYSEVEYSKVKQGELEEFELLSFTYDVIDLGTQSFTIPYTITAEDGTIKNYEIILKRKSTNNSILEVSVNDTILETDENGNYIYNVPDNVDNVHVKVVTEDDYGIARIQEIQNIKIAEKQVDISGTEKFVQIPISVISQSGLENNKNIIIEKISENKNILYVKMQNEEITKVENTFKYFIYETRNSVELEIQAESQYSKIELFDIDNNLLSSQTNNLQYELGTSNQVNNFRLIITAENGDFEESNIIIEKMSLDNSLKELYLNGTLVELNENNEYSISVLDNEPFYTVKAITNNEFAYVRIALHNEYQNIAESNVTLSTERTTIIPISIRSQAGIATVVNLYIEKIATSNNISIVKVNDREARYVQSKSTYINVVNRDLTEFELFIMAENDSSIIIYDGVEYTASLMTIVTMPIEQDGMSLNVIVKSEDETEKSYIIEFVRESENTELQYIKLNGVEIQLDDGSDYTYTVMVKNILSSVQVEVKTVASYSEIRIGDNIVERSVSEATIAVDSYQNEIIPVVVRAPDGITVKTYNIVLYKGDNNTNITVNVNGNKITPDSNGIYKVVLKGGTLNSNVEIIAQSEKTSINFNGVINLATVSSIVELNNAINNFSIIAKAEDETQKEYTLVIEKTTNIDGSIITENINNIHKADIRVYRTSDVRQEAPKGYVFDPENPENIYREEVAKLESLESGNIEIVLPVGGEYDVLITKKGYLDFRIIGIDILSGDLVTLNQYILLAGDIVKTNEIEIEDFAKINDKFGLKLTLDNMEENSMYDLNEDGLINRLDRDIVKKNYGLKSIIVYWGDFVKDIIVTSPIKTSYKIGEEIDLTGAQITTFMDSGIDGETITINPDMISGFDTSTVGSKVITVTYLGFTKTFSITVSDPIIGIEIQSPIKVNYLYGENLDLAGGTIIVKNESGETIGPLSITTEMISEFEPTVLGIQTITVTYLGYSNTFNVNVIDWDKELVIIQNPKTLYEYGESLNVIDGRIAIYTASGAISSNMPGNQSIAITPDMVSGFNPNQQGSQILTISYKGFNVNYTIVVEPEIQNEFTFPEETGTTPIVNSQITFNNIVGNNLNNVENSNNEENNNIDNNTEDKLEDTEISTEQKPVETLGTKDKREITKEQIALVGLVSAGAFTAILIAIRRKKEE